MTILWWIIVGLIAGWATGKIMRGAGYGPIMDIVVGIVGALIGGWIMRSVGFAGRGGTLYTILVAIGGAIVLTWILRMITGRRTSSITNRDRDNNIRRAA
ncbi:MAG TPA: GlsB/YeaQ/YmgE family stress response membrane protein [Candidatus Acidoferrales bacterium]|nr:GlsB/YeaQ/YmgE family stress response membrane protein [Candidatus Acidoferrales bacterium]